MASGAGLFPSSSLFQTAKASPKPVSRASADSSWEAEGWDCLLWLTENGHDTLGDRTLWDGPACQCDMRWPDIRAGPYYRLSLYCRSNSLDSGLDPISIITFT